MSPYLSLPVRSLLSVRAVRLIARLGPVALWALSACQGADIPEGANPLTYRSPEAVCSDQSSEWTRILAGSIGAAVQNATRSDKAEYDLKMAECLRGQKDGNSSKDP